MTTTPKYSRIYTGMTGLLKSELTKQEIDSLISQCTRVKDVFRGEPTPDDVVVAAIEGNDYLWVPRYFKHGIPARGPVKNAVTKGSFKVDIDFKFTPSEERDQVRSILEMNRALDQKAGGILKAFTGAGKSLMSMIIASKYKCPIGVIVSQRSMLSGWLKELKKITYLEESDIGFVAGKQCDLGRPVTIMMAQSLLNADRYPQELFDQFGCLIVDECELFAAKVWSTIFHRFPAKYRIGMSATPFRKDGLEDVFGWHLGEVEYKAQKKGDIEKPIFIERTIAMDVDESKIQDRGTASFVKYCNFIHTWKPATYCLVEQVIKALRMDRKILILTHRKKHPWTIKKILEECIDLDGDCDPDAKVKVLSAGPTQRDIDEAMKAEVTISTFKQLSRAYSDENLDTMFWVMQPGSNLNQPLGRLRRKDKNKLAKLREEGFKRQDLVVVWISTFLDYDDKRSRQYEKDLRAMGVELKRQDIEPIKTIVQLRKKMKPREPLKDTRINR